MFRAYARLFLVALLVLLSGASARAMDVPQGMVRLPGHVLPSLAHATVVRTKPGSDAQPITLTVVLRRDDQAGFELLLHDVYDPHSKQFHHYLSQSQIADSFGPSQSEYQQLITYLENSGFKIVERSKNRLTLTVRGTRAQAERAFAIHVSDYRIGSQSFFANDLDPAVPMAISAHVSAIAGLSNLAKPQVTSDAIRRLGTLSCPGSKAPRQL